MTPKAPFYAPFILPRRHRPLAYGVVPLALTTWIPLHTPLTNSVAPTFGVARTSQYHAKGRFDHQASLDEFNATRPYDTRPDGFSPSAVMMQHHNPYDPTTHDHISTHTSPPAHQATPLVNPSHHQHDAMPSIQSFWHRLQHQIRHTSDTPLGAIGLFMAGTTLFTGLFGSLFLLVGFDAFIGIGLSVCFALTLTFVLILYCHDD